MIVDNSDPTIRGRILERLMRAEDNDEGPLTIRQIAHDINASRAFVNDIIDRLAGAGHVDSRRTSTGERGWVRSDA